MQLLWCDMYINLDTTDKKFVSSGLFYAGIMIQNIGIMRNIAIGEFKIWGFPYIWSLRVYNFTSFCDLLQLKVRAALLKDWALHIHLTWALALSIKFFNQIKPSRVVESHFDNAIVNLSKVVSNVTKYIFGLTVFS